VGVKGVGRIEVEGTFSCIFATVAASAGASRSSTKRDPSNNLIHVYI
jgi:hypothetical protein